MSWCSSWVPSMCFWICKKIWRKTVTHTYQTRYHHQRNKTFYESCHFSRYSGGWYNLIVYPFVFHFDVRAKAILLKFLLKPLWFALDFCKQTYDITKFTWNVLGTSNTIIRLMKIVLHVHVFKKNLYFLVSMYNSS